MKITLSPESPRTLAPIRIDVSGARERPAVVVSSGGRDLFAVDMDGADGTRGVFWVAQPGDYALRAAAAAETVSATFRVREQVFLSFPAEFGAFAAALFLAGGGLILWFRSRKKAGATSGPSRS